jgi:hypothetical protein
VKREDCKDCCKDEQMDGHDESRILTVSYVPAFLFPYMDLTKCRTKSYIENLYAAVVELVYTPVLGTGVRKNVKVQVLSAAL